MKAIDTKQMITDLFQKRYPKTTVDFKKYKESYYFSSNFDDKSFVRFVIQGGTISHIKTNNRYLPEVKNLFSIHKMKRIDFKIIDEFFRLINSNSNFNKVFKLRNNMTANDWFSFKRSSDFFSLPLLPDTKYSSFLVDKLHNIHYRIYFENHFKMNKNGSFFIVPMIKFFDNRKNKQLFAINIYEKTIHYVKKEEFFFDDFFENNAIFDPEYHGDVFVDEYIDNLIYQLDSSDEIRQELILYPRDKLSTKVDLLSMYTI